MARDASTTRAGHGGRGGRRRQRIVRAFDGGTQRVLVRASGDGGTIAEYRTTSASVFDGGTTTAGSASVLRRRHNRGASVFSTAARRRVIGIAMPYYRGTANVELVFCDIMVSLRYHGVFGRRWSIQGRFRRFKLSAVVEPLVRGTCHGDTVTG